MKNFKLCSRNRKEILKSTAYEYLHFHNLNDRIHILMSYPFIKKKKRTHIFPPRTHNISLLQQDHNSRHAPITQKTARSPPNPLPLNLATIHLILPRPKNWNNQNPFGALAHTCPAKRQKRRRRGELISGCEIIPRGCRHTYFLTREARNASFNFGGAKEGETRIRAPMTTSSFCPAVVASYGRNFLPERVRSARVRASGYTVGKIIMRAMILKLLHVSGGGILLAGVSF